MLQLHPGYLCVSKYLCADVKACVQSDEQQAKGSHAHRESVLPAGRLVSAFFSIGSQAFCSLDFCCQIRLKLSKKTQSL